MKPYTNYALLVILFISWNMIEQRHCICLNLVLINTNWIHFKIKCIKSRFNILCTWYWITLIYLPSASVVLKKMFVAFPLGFVEKHQVFSITLKHTFPGLFLFTVSRKIKLFNSRCQLPCNLFRQKMLKYTKDFQNL